MNPYLAVRVALLIVNVLLVIWVVQDARKRHARSAVWGIITLLLGIIGWAIYLFARPAVPPKEQESMPDNSKARARDRMDKQVRVGFRHDSESGILRDDIFD